MPQHRCWLPTTRARVPCRCRHSPLAWSRFIFWTASQVTEVIGRPAASKLAKWIDTPCKRDARLSGQNNPRLPLCLGKRRHECSQGSCATPLERTASASNRLFILPPIYCVDRFHPNNRPSPVSWRIQKLSLHSRRSQSSRRIGTDKRYDSIWSDSARECRGTTESGPPNHFG